jgi:hypothetical protein
MKKHSWEMMPVSKSVSQIEFTDVPGGWEQYIMLTSDRHHDNAYSRNKLEKKHLDMALERNAPIIDIGDLFCAMQGRNDRRRSRDELKHEFAEADNYFDLILDEAEEFYSPYAHLFTVMAHGNHETAVRRHSGIDLTYNIARRLRRIGGEIWPRPGAYGGYIKLRVTAGRSSTLNLRFFHGAGGAAPVTKGVIQSQRRSQMWPDANIIVCGHTHEAFAVPWSQERINTRGKIYNAIQWHIQLPSYKDEYYNGGEFHIERGGGPKPLGCAWLKLTYDTHKRGNSLHVLSELDIE